MWRGAHSANRRVGSKPYLDRAGADRLERVSICCQGGGQVWRGAHSADRRMESRPYLDRAGAARLLILSSNCFKNTCLGWAGQHVGLTGVVNRSPFGPSGGGQVGAGVHLLTGRRPGVTGGSVC